MHVTESYPSVATTHYFTEILFNIIIQCFLPSLTENCRSAANKQTALYDTLVYITDVHQAVNANYFEPENSSLESDLTQAHTPTTYCTRTSPMCPGLSVVYGL